MFELFNFESFDFVTWYLSLPLPAQIALVVGAIAIASLAILFAVYLVKWTILAIVYIIKGIIKLIKRGVKKIKDATFAPCCPPVSAQEKDPFAEKAPVASPVPIRAKIPGDNVPRFCAQCGTTLDANARARLGTGQSTFCPQCGASLAEGGSRAPASAQA